MQARRVRRHAGALIGLGVRSMSIVPSSKLDH